MQNRLAFSAQFVFAPFRYQWRPTTASYRLAIEVVLNLRGEGTEYGLSRQEGAKVTWKPCLLDRGQATVLMHAYSESVDSM